MTRARLVALLLLVAVVVAAAALWFWRDLPRRRVESALAAKLSADVSLGGLRIEGVRSFVLRDLVVRRVAGQPRLALARVDRLEAHGDPRAILEGRFDRLHLDGVELRLGPPDPSVPPPPPGPAAPLVAAALTLNRGRAFFATERGELAVDLEADVRDFGGATSGTARAGAAALSLTPLGVDAEIRELDAAATFAGSEVKIEARASADGIATLGGTATVDLATLRPAELEAVVLGIDLERWLPLVPGRPEALTARGSVDLRARLPRDGRLAWTLDAELAEPQGKAHLGGDVALQDPLAGGPIAGTIDAVVREIPVHADLEGSVVARPEPRFDGLARMVARGIGPIAVVGHASPVGSAGTFSIPPTPVSQLGLPLPEMLGVEGTIRATGELAWPGAPAIVRASVLASDLEARYGDHVRLEGGKARAELVASSLAEPWTVRALELEGRATAAPLDPFPLSLRGTARLDPSTAAIADAALDVAVGDLATAKVAGRWSAGSGGAAKVEITGLDATRWQRVLRPIVGDPAPGFVAKGTARATIDATIDPGLAWSATGTASIDGSGFTSDDGSRVVEGLDTRWTFSADGTRAVARGRARAEVSGFQALWGSFFADYAGIPSTLEGQAETDGASFKGRVAWTWPGGPRLDLDLSRGSAAKGVAYEGAFEVADLASTLSRYLREPLGAAVPLFERIEGKGALRVEVRGLLDEGVTLAGRLLSDGLSLSGTQGVVEIEGLALDLPFDLRWSSPGKDGRRVVDGRDREGSLRFARFAARGMEIPATETALRIRADSVELVEPLAFPLLDGIAGFERLTLTEFARPTRRLETALLLSKIDLQTTSKAFGLPPLSGVVDGYFPRVVVTGPSFQVDGGGEVAVFGGRVTIGGISGEDVLTRFPKLRLSADFEDVDLALVTRTFDFGAMTGIVRGHVHDLTLFRGVPTAFEARLETVERRGVRGRIHVKAVNNLAILSTGSPGLLDRGIQKFIDSFTYDRLGLELSLASDVFRMRGLERRGDRELFVKGRLPFPIDIVNAQPGRTVSFRAMLDRIGNVDFSVGGKGPPKPR